MIQALLLLSLLAPRASAETTAAISEDMLNLRDPFKRPLIIKEKVEPKTELEAFAADQYKMIGVITGLDRLRAIVVDPNGKTHFVAEGMRIGLRRGVVKKILNDTIKVREKMINVVGQEENVEVEIRLPAENTPASAADLNASEVVPQPASPIGQVGVPKPQQIEAQAPVTPPGPPAAQPQAQPASAAPAVGSPAATGTTGAFVSPIIRKSMEGGSK